MLSTDRKSAELTPSVNEPQRRRGYTELLERRAKISVETTEGWRKKERGDRQGKNAC